MTKGPGIRSAKWLRWALAVSLVFACWAFWVSQQSVEGEVAATYAGAEPSLLPRGQRCQANRDGKVDEKDVSLISLFWQGFPEPLADCNSDGKVDVLDAGILINRWTATTAVEGISVETVGSRQPLFSIAYDKPPETWQSGDHVLALVRVSSMEKIAAAEVTLTYPSDAVSVVRARTSPTAMPVWFMRPDLRQAGGLSFAVGKPNGLSGAGTILALDLAIMDPVRARLAFGLGTSAVSYEAEGTRLAVVALERPEMVAEGDFEVFRTVDTVPPEETKAYTYILHTSAGDRYVVAFSGLDAESGISRRVVEEQGVHTVLDADAYVLRSAATKERALNVQTFDAFGNVRETAVKIFLP